LDAFESTFYRSSCSLVGCVHLLPLPGSAGFRGDLSAIVRRATEEARILAGEGFDALLVENTHDAPYLLGRIEPETVAALAVAASAVRAAVERLPVGVQALAAANREALGVAVAAGLDFVRVENFAFAHVADEGLMARASAPELVRTRAHLGAERVLVLADVKKKHASHAITQDLTLTEAVRGAEFCRADAVVVTGEATGRETAPEDVREARAASALPVFVGSGVTVENVARYVPHARALIVGSSLKEEGDWRRALDPGRCRALRRALDEAMRA
jgi:membrane complex biogenesis BtpA family protein